VIYCARGQAENLIKMHKSQLACDRTSCRSPIANQVRLVLLTAAYWMKSHQLAKAEFAMLPLRLLKLGARVTEPSRASVWHSPPLVPRPACSAISRAPSSRPRRERRGSEAPMTPTPWRLQRVQQVLHKPR
jgi:hypothetical protein